MTGRHKHFIALNWIQAESINTFFSFLFSHLSPGKLLLLVPASSSRLYPTSNFSFPLLISFTSSEAFLLPLLPPLVFHVECFLSPYESFTRQFFLPCDLFTVRVCLVQWVALNAIFVYQRYFGWRWSVMSSDGWCCSGWIWGRVMWSFEWVFVWSNLWPGSFANFIEF